eukprot:766888-Hanusia_phi.AAC.2
MPQICKRVEEVALAVEQEGGFKYLGIDTSINPALVRNISVCSPSLTGGLAVARWQRGLCLRESPWEGVSLRRSGDPRGGSSSNFSGERCSSEACRILRADAPHPRGSRASFACVPCHSLSLTRGLGLQRGQTKGVSQCRGCLPGLLCAGSDWTLCRWRGKAARRR